MKWSEIVRTITHANLFGACAIKITDITKNEDGEIALKTDYFTSEELMQLAAKRDTYKTFAHNELIIENMIESEKKPPPKGHTGRILSHEEKQSLADRLENKHKTP